MSVPDYNITHTLDDKGNAELGRLVNNGFAVPPLKIGTITLENGCLYVSKADLLKALEDLAGAAVSDQKQDAYRGLHQIISLLM